MSKELYRGARDIDSRALTELGLKDKNVAPFCGTEEYHSNGKKTIVSFQCYAVHIYASGSDLMGMGLKEAYTNLDIVKDYDFVTRSELNGRNIFITPYIHKTPANENIIQNNIARYRRGIFGSTKRKYTPAQRDERILGMMGNTLDDASIYAREMFKGVRATIASILEAQGMEDISIDFVQAEEFRFDEYFNEYCTGMVVMSGEAFISTFLHTINEDTYVLATVYGREGERVHNLHTINRGDGAESAMRSLSSAIVEFVTTVEKQRGD